jgi:hypothetical protein
MIALADIQERAFQRLASPQPQQVDGETLVTVTLSHPEPSGISRPEQNLTEAPGVDSLIDLGG